MMGMVPVRVAALALTLAVSACRAARPSPPKNPAAGHEHTAPHHGQLVELGDEFAHVELVLDRKIGTLTAYVLDGEAEQPVRVVQPSLTLVCTAPLVLEKQPLELVAAANVLTGEKSGDSSEFAAGDAALRDLVQMEGRILQVTVKGRTFRDVPFRASATQ
jgi:hypothetical protein